MRSAEFCLNTTCLSCLTIGNKFFLVLIFPPTANSGIFNNCTCCAPKKRQKDMDPEASRTSKRERTNAEWEGKWSRLLEVQGDDEDDNCSSSSSSTTTTATSQQPRQRQDDEARLQVQPALEVPGTAASAWSFSSGRTPPAREKNAPPQSAILRLIWLLVGEINYVANAKCSALCGAGRSCRYIHTYVCIWGGFRGAGKVRRTASSGFIYHCSFLCILATRQTLGVGVFHISGTTCRSCSWRSAWQCKAARKDSEIRIKEIRKSVDKVTSLGWRCLLG